MDPNNENTEGTATSLHDKLRQQTETKAPSANAQSLSWMPEGDEGINTATETIEETKTTEPTTAPASKKEMVPDSVKRASAETATLMYDQLLTVFGSFRVNTKFKKRFSIEEMMQVNDLDLEHTPIENLTSDVDKQIHIKFNSLLKKRDKKIAKLPLDDYETKRITDSFYHVFKLKDIAMPPEYLLYANLAFTFIDRAIETEID